jgi:putative addiction module killer protein
VKEIRRSSVYNNWFMSLRDIRAKTRIDFRIQRLIMGNPGDVKPAGEGISEMRIDYGPGYRVYYKDTGKEIIILLCGGDKRTQQADIVEARKIARAYKEEN